MLTSLEIVDKTNPQMATQICTQVRYQLCAHVFREIGNELAQVVWNQVIMPLKDAKRESLDAYSFKNTRNPGPV